MNYELTIEEVKKLVHDESMHFSEQCTILCKQFYERTGCEIERIEMHFLGKATACGIPPPYPYKVFPKVKGIDLP